MLDYAKYGKDTAKYMKRYCVTKKAITVTFVDGEQQLLENDYMNELYLQQRMLNEAKEVYDKKGGLQKNINKGILKCKCLRFFGGVGTVLSMIGLGYTLIESAPGTFQSISLMEPGTGIAASLCLSVYAKRRQRKLRNLKDDLNKIEFLFDQADILDTEIQNIDWVMLGLTNKQAEELKNGTSGLPMINFNSINCLSTNDLKMLVRNMTDAITFEQLYPSDSHQVKMKRMI